VRVDDGIGVILGISVFVIVGAGTVLVGRDVAVGGGVVVFDGVIDGVQVIVGVKVGKGVAEGKGVAVGSGVAVGGGGGVGVQVTVGVEDGVQEMIGLGTASRRSWQPLAKSMITPKSLLTTPGSAPPPAQSLSKSIAQVYELPLLNGTEPLQLVGDDESNTPSPFPPRWK